ncbi:MAG: MFS transporter [Alphaproteobacteria bacterium]|nr:MFS transporter [Alphaproteobacteria bacterium]
MSDATLTQWRTPALVIAAGCLLTVLVFGIRASFGVFLDPMTAEFGWGREVFALSMAVQNLLWGLGQPIAGAIADRYGSARVLSAGLALYGLGLFLMADASTPAMLHVSAGFLIGIGMSAASFSVVLAAFGRLVPEERRSWAFGVGTAAGSLGQFLMVPLGQAFISAYGWSTALVLLGFGIIAMIAVTPVLSSRAGNVAGERRLSINEALRESLGHRSYVYLTTGFFVCGFQVSFLTFHFPAFIIDAGLDPALGAWAIAIVGLFNVVGSYCAGLLGGRLSKRNLLCWIYLLRSLVFAVFILVPISDVSVMVFAATMGLLWLSTVPLTSGLVAQMFGIGNMAMLFGIVFFGHQVGSFVGVWFGGYIFDATGSYDIMWWLCVATGIAAALIHWPIDERPVRRLAEAR